MNQIAKAIGLTVLLMSGASQAGIIYQTDGEIYTGGDNTTDILFHFDDNNRLSYIFNLEAYGKMYDVTVRDASTYNEMYDNDTGSREVGGVIAQSFRDETTKFFSLNVDGLAPGMKDNLANCSSGTKCRYFLPYERYGKRYMHSTQASAASEDWDYFASFHTINVNYDDEMSVEAYLLHTLTSSREQQVEMYDAFTLSATPVSEPWSLSIFALGLAGLVWRKKKANQS